MTVDKVSWPRLIWGQDRVLLMGRQEFTMKTLYKVIGFGENEHGFFNQKACASTIGYASGFYSAMINDPEYMGAVIIKQDHETWQVILEFGTEGMSIECGPFMSFSVKKAPKIVMV